MTKKVVQQSYRNTSRRGSEKTDKPMAPQLLRCKGFAVKYYSFNLYASDLQHPRLLQH
jgi:hypothetical protein